MKTLLALLLLLTLSVSAQTVTLVTRVVGGQPQILVTGTPGEYYWVDVSDDGGRTWDTQVYRFQAGEWYLPSTNGNNCRWYRVSGLVE